MLCAGGGEVLPLIRWLIPCPLRSCQLQGCAWLWAGDSLGAALCLEGVWGASCKGLGSLHGFTVPHLSGRDPIP
jgi:hypothetical protein